MPPRKRLPITSSEPFLSCSTNLGNVAKIVAVVGVGHEHIGAARRLNPAAEGIAVSAMLHVDHSCAGGLCKFD